MSFNAYAQATGEGGIPDASWTGLLQHLGLPGVLAYLAIRGIPIPVRLHDDDRALAREVIETLKEHR